MNRIWVGHCTQITLVELSKFLSQLLLSTTCSASYSLYDPFFLSLRIPLDLKECCKNNTSNGFFLAVIYFFNLCFSITAKSLSTDILLWPEREYQTSMSSKTLLTHSWSRKANKTRFLFWLNQLSQNIFKYRCSCFDCMLYTDKVWQVILKSFLN